VLDFHSVISVAVEASRILADECRSNGRDTEVESISVMDIPPVTGIFVGPTGDVALPLAATVCRLL
jgi:hypothetical protein